MGYIDGYLQVDSTDSTDINETRLFIIWMILSSIEHNSVCVHTHSLTISYT
jgi:hypothetical protein